MPLLQGLLVGGHQLALVPQTLVEFIHVVTDPRRMPKPLMMDEALGRAEHWWQAAEVVRVFPTSQSVSHFHCWLAGHRLGRKRLLDTMLAAVLHSAGIGRIITNNEKDFKALGVLEVVTFRQ